MTLRPTEGIRVPHRERLFLSLSGMKRKTRPWQDEQDLEQDLEQDFQDIQDSQDFVSPSEQDLAILLYRVGWCMGGPCSSRSPDREQVRIWRSCSSVSPTVARDRPSPYGKAWSIDIKVLRTFSPCYYRTSIDIKVLTDLKTSFPNPDNLANLENPAFLI